MQIQSSYVAPPRVQSGEVTPALCVAKGTKRHLAQAGEVPYSVVVECREGFAVEPIWGCKCFSKDRSEHRASVSFGGLEHLIIERLGRP